MKSEDGSIVGPNEGTGEQKELVTKGSESEALPIIGQAYALKRRDEVIGQVDDLQIEVVGRESPRRDVGECEILAQFADAHLDGGSTVVEMPDARRGEVQVGDPASIIVASELKERQVVFCRFDQAPGNHMASGF